MRKFVECIIVMSFERYVYEKDLMEWMRKGCRDYANWVVKTF